MGGEDLGSEDEDYLAPLRAASSDDEAQNAYDDDDEDGHIRPVKNVRGPKSTTGQESGTNTTTSSSKKRKRGGDGNSLQDLGKGIRTASTEIQAELLTRFSGVKFLPSHVGRYEEGTRHGDDDDDDDDCGIAKRIQSIISKKKLKRWKENSSPCVIIVALSARRAVQVLKELAPLNVRAAKLFAKHIPIEEQVKQLQESNFPIAVGTPHRIVALAKNGALSFEKTLCIALDTSVNDKKFSVYTLPDTVPHTQDLLKEFVHPECINRRDVRVAFV